MLRSPPSVLVCCPALTIARFIPLSFVALCSEHESAKGCILSSDQLLTPDSGTWQAKPGEVAKAVEIALKSGYKLIDAAYCYANEDEVGQGLKAAFDSGIKREDIFVVTKLWNTYSTRTEVGLDKSLKSLGLDYVDLFLVHWAVGMNPNGTRPDGGDADRFPLLPNGERDILWDHDHVQTWKDMEALVKTGKAKSIGVCNYSKVYIENLLKHATIVPAVNQIENSPALPQQEIVDICNQNKIHIMAYSPLGSTGGPLMKSEIVTKLAEKKGVSAGTILLSYHGKYSALPSPLLPLFHFWGLTSPMA